MSRSEEFASLGWSPRWEAALSELNDPTVVPARVAVETKGSYTVLAPEPAAAQASGRLRHSATARSDLPAVGDWVALRAAPEDGARVIDAVLPRAAAFVRKVAGFETEPQVVAANVDVVFVLASVEHEVNLRRVERYLTLAWESGAAPAVILTKADLCDDVARELARVAAVAPGSTVHAVSAFTGERVGSVAALVGGGRTAALIGPSGAGKSTLVNALAGDVVMTVQSVRDYDGKGRHTTTHRQLVRLPGGGCLIDTPGMRELQLWDADEGIDAAFADIAELAASCRFRDCAHESEPGCAVTAAADAGSLSAERLTSYRKQQRELAAIARKKDKRLASLETKRWKTMNREARAVARERW